MSLSTVPAYYSLRQMPSVRILSANSHTFKLADCKCPALITEVASTELRHSRTKPLGQNQMQEHLLGAAMRSMATIHNLPQYSDTWNKVRAKRAMPSTKIQGWQNSGWIDFCYLCFQGSKWRQKATALLSCPPSVYCAKISKTFLLLPIAFLTFSGFFQFSHQCLWTYALKIRPLPRFAY
jgi:hypothetical protein